MLALEKCTNRRKCGFSIEQCLLAIEKSLVASESFNKMSIFHDLAIPKAVFFAPQSETLAFPIEET